MVRGKSSSEVRQMFNIKTTENDNISKLTETPNSNNDPTSFEADSMNKHENMDT